MQIISLAWGVLAIFGMFIGLIPCLGSLNWLNIPFAGVGLIFSIVALLSGRDSSRTPAIIGLVCCAIAVLLGTKRLILGGGII